ncbi:cupin domain-containing protein [Fluviibacter phosphoraccumulans]|uniref:cupin domain-containing protein n=1 Tax=Fluviibacter phosphoraccumulans TaxID=1751046 RepID=UPI0024E19BD9|nr:cupin domain-containing protein [Fluviibacter phosphoraccumulans]
MRRLQPYFEVTPYITKDGSKIRELMHPAVHGNTAQSLAEATISAGKRTLLHRHHKAEEIYYVISGRGRMTLGDDLFPIKTGDTVCIPPGTPHRVEAVAPTPLRILCCCSPAYAHDDTELLEAAPIVAAQPIPVISVRGTEPSPTYNPDHAPYEGRNLRDLRKSLGYSQARFWKVIHVTQSGGSRYEAERHAPAQVRALVQLAYGPAEGAQALLAELRKGLPLDYKPDVKTFKAAINGETARALRKRIGMTQRAFWMRVMVTQSGGNSYEAGRDIPLYVQTLLQLVFGKDEQAKALLAELRQRAA